MGQLPAGSIKLIETKKDAEALEINKFKKPLAYITQTTISVDDTAEIINYLKNKFPNIKGPVKEDICYATTNRQAAVKKIASRYLEVDDYKNYKHWTSSLNVDIQKNDLLELYPKGSILNKMTTKKNFYDAIILAVPHKIFKMQPTLDTVICLQYLQFD